MNIGHYHGYKGYRHINTPLNHVPYTKFEEDNYKMFSTEGKMYKNAYDRQKTEEKLKRELKRRLAANMGDFRIT